MVLLIAGSRVFSTLSKEDLVQLIDAAVQFVCEQIGEGIEEIVEGDAPGIDKGAGLYGEIFGIPVTKKPAKWSDLDVPGAVVKINRYGKPYNARAGHDRNKEMAEYTKSKNGMLLAITPPIVTSGTKNMIEQARDIGLPFIHYIVEVN